MCVFFNSNSYSVDIAKVFGVRNAVFISMLFRKTDCVTEKGMPICRQDIFNMTGLTNKEQEDVENALVTSGVIVVNKVRNSNEKNYYIVNEDCLCKYLNIDYDRRTQQLLVPNDAPKKKRVTKKEQLVNKIKSSLTIDDEVIKQYVCDWIDTISVNDKIYLTKSSVDLSLKELFSFSDNKDTILDILKIAIKRGLKDLSWAIDSYKKSFGNNEIGAECWSKYEKQDVVVNTSNGAF